MTGVEILAIEEVVTKYAFNWGAFAITVGLIFVAYFIVGLCCCFSRYGDKKDVLWGVILGIICGVFFGYFVGHFLHTPTTYDQHYKVTISEEVKMTEFPERYAIIDQEGKIYTVRERD